MIKHKFDIFTRGQLAKLQLPSYYLNIVRLDPSSGKKHKIAVLKLCIEAIKNDHNFITRAVLNKPFLKDSVIGDFYDIDDNLIIEIVYSESMNSIKRKQKIWEENGFNFKYKRVKL